MTHKELMNEADMLQGNINRMMVTNDKDELLKMYAFALERLGKIYRERIYVSTIQPEPHWIPTSERLPKISEDVLLSYFDEVTIGWLNSDGSWSIFDGWECVSADEISAWLPLPEAYKPSVIEKCLGEKCHE